MYKIFLENHPQYEKIFVTDTRDVFFQGDLFSSYPDYKNFLVYATEAELIKNDKGNNNQTWIRHLFDEIEYQKLADKIIICCGTVYGSRAEMNIFIDNMIEILKRSTAWGDEQAAMNYLVHNKLLPIENLIESDVNAGEIFTAGIFENKRAESGKVLRGNGGVPAVVHQFPPPFADENYRKFFFDPDENFTDFQSALDQVFCLVQRQNFSAATKFFINYVAYAENLNSYGEKLLKLAQLILQRYNPDAEILFSALQKTFANIFSANINIQQFENLYRIFIVAEKNLHCVNPSFKIFIKNMLVAFTDIFYKNNQQDFAREYIKRLTDWRD